MPGNMNQVWYNDLSTIRKMMMDLDFTSVCPSCKMPFDKGKKRKLTDVCGHDRCYSCIYNSDKCALCLQEQPAYVALGTQIEESSKGEVVVNSGQLPPRSKLKTNGHFTTYMQTRSVQCSASANHQKITIKSPLTQSQLTNCKGYCASSAEASPICPRKKLRAPSPSARNRAWLRRPFFHASSANLDTKSTTTNSDDEDSVNPPPPVHAAKSDLYMRLGLLLGDRARGRNERRRGPPSQSSSQESYASESSLNSSDNTKTSSSHTSPLSTLTGFSESESLNAPSFSLSSSLDPSLDSVVSCSPLSSIPRRHSVTTTSSGPVEELFLFDKRKAPIRRSARVGTVKGPVDPRIRFAPYRAPQINLKPQFFEVPQQELDPVFVGRNWLFKEIEQELSNDSSSNGGVVIVGGVGNGKTAVILQLVENSCFSRRPDENIYQSIEDHGSKTSLLSSSLGLNVSSTSLRTLGGQIVAYHFCQADNSVTCLVPDFVHSIAAQLCQAPQLAAYRTLVGSDSQLQTLLSIKECIANPSAAFVKGILDPLCNLKSSGKIPSATCIIVIDALDEAEYHRPDCGVTIATFISQHAAKFPQWLKLITTVRTTLQDVTKNFPYHRISLDRISTNEHLQRDLHKFITLRITASPTVPNNIAINGKMDAALQTRFTSHLLHQSRGSFLYLRLTLDLVERGQLVMKSTSFKVLPQNLNEIYMLHFNLKFPSLRSYEKIVMILNVCLASLYPMTLLEMYHSVNAGSCKQFLMWEDFIQRMEVLQSFLIRRQDGSYMFFHPSFREWLMRRDQASDSSSKFLCNPRAGHCNIAFRMSRLESPLDADKTCELGHHILKAHIYKNVGLDPGYSSRDMQALWLCHSSSDISQALGSLRNIYCPNVKVSRLLLLSGSNADFRTTTSDESPILVICAQQGYKEMVALLLEFGANVEATNNNGQNALSLAAANGHADVVRLLYTRGAQINYIDPSGHCALSYASSNGHIAVTSFLLQSDWPNTGSSFVGFQEAAQRALVCAAANGHVQVCEYLINLPVVGIDLVDTLTGDTALTAAAAQGRRETCSLVIQSGSCVSVTGRDGVPALVRAVLNGHWEVAELLLINRADVNQPDLSGRTPLMAAAAEGHLGILELLLSKGAEITVADNDERTALSWSCIKGQVHVAQCLLEHGADINHTDKTGRSALDLAAECGEPTIVQLLLDKGALVEHVDHSGMRPLDRAISCRNTEATMCFLRKGAKLGPATWAMAAGKPDIIFILLNKLSEDGLVLYKKNRFLEASHRYQYALKKFPIENSLEDEMTFKQLKTQMMLNLVRCKRKLKEYDSALELIDKILAINPKSFEAFYARARVHRDMNQFSLALEDLNESMKLSPQNKDIHRVLSHLREEIKELDNPTNLLQLGSLGGSLEAIERCHESDGVLV